MQRLPRLLKIFVFATLLTLSLSLQNCEKSNPIIADNDDFIDLSVTPRENREAEEAALWLSHELIAPEGLYQTIKDDLESIRSEYLKQIPQLAIEFRITRWIISFIVLRPTDDGYRKMQLGNYYELDSLNTLFRVVQVDTLSSHSVTLTFEGRLNPWRLVEYYQELDEVRWASPVVAGNPLIPLSLVYPWIIDGEMSYLFMGSECWYFRARDQKIEYVGHFGYSDPLPDWWDEARIGYEEYWGPYE